MRACWCGNTKLALFDARYGECRSCGTLVYLEEQPPERFLAGDDPSHLYGKQYWLGRQQELYGFADIHARARSDLAERNLHWLKALLKYRLPPARVLELGCAHGSFVALLRHAGFEAFGAEMSPWVVEYARQTFGIDVRTGPIETLDIEPGSLDVIALMDVLEHLPDPVATMRCCLERLRPGGLLLIQTPEYRPDISHDELVRKEAPFLEQLKTDEHLYLLSRRSVKDLFRRLGAGWIRFEPAIFSQYDMFFVVAREVLLEFGQDEIHAALAASASGRVTGALLDLREREVEAQRCFREADSDRVARATQIEQLTGLVHAMEAEGIERLATVGEQLKASEADRLERGRQIESLTRTLHEVEADRASRGAQVETLTRRLREVEIDSGDRARQIATLADMLRAAESDRAARGEQIDVLSGRLREVEVESADRVRQVESLTRTLREAEVDRADRASQIESLTRTLREVEVDRADRARQIELLTHTLREVEVDRADRAHQIESLTRMLRDAEVDRAARGEQIVTLTQQLKDVEADRADRGRQIEALGGLLRAAAVDRTRLETHAAAVAAELAQTVADRTALAEEIAATNTQLERLLGRKAFRWISRLAGWREARRLAELLKVRR